MVNGLPQKCKGNSVENGEFSQQMVLEQLDNHMQKKNEPRPKALSIYEKKLKIDHNTIKLLE